MSAPAWVEDMRAAKVLLVDGMVVADPHTGAPLKLAHDDMMIHRRVNEDDGRLVREFAGYVPWIEDRATFLLCLDEAERRNVDRFWFADNRYYMLHEARTWEVWTAEERWRPLLLCALARALREGAP